MIPPSLSRWIEQVTGLGPGVQGKLLWSLVILLLAWLTRRLALVLAWRRTEDVRTRYQWKKFTAYSSFFAALLALGWVWLQGFTAVATYLGLLSAGVAIALKEPLVNLVGWMFIIWRRPFEAGDRIQIGKHAGDVIDQRIFQFTLLEIGNWVAADQSTGRVIHIPNGRVFSDAVANFTHGFDFIWNEIPVLITFESNWREAKRILLEVTERHGTILGEAAREQVHRAARRFMIFYSALTPTVYTSVEDSGVLLTIRYLCAPRQRRGSAQAIWEEVLERFGEREDIDFAYPTRRFYDHAREGKSGLVPPGGSAGG